MEELYQCCNGNLKEGHSLDCKTRIPQITRDYETQIQHMSEELERLRAEVAALKKLSVTNIMLDVIPGDDGMGEEVYAKSVAEVEQKLTALAEKLDETLSAYHEQLLAETWAKEDALKAPVGMEPVAEVFYNPESGPHLRWVPPYGRRDFPGLLYSAAQLAQVQRERDEVQQQFTDYSRLAKQVIADLEAELDAYKKDAERYRWLTRNGGKTIQKDERHALISYGYWGAPEEIDSAIDAATQKEKE